MAGNLLSRAKKPAKMKMDARANPNTTPFFEQQMTRLTNPNPSIPTSRKK
jgi:hypothetical protein